MPAVVVAGWPLTSTPCIVPQDRPLVPAGFSMRGDFTTTPCAATSKPPKKQPKKRASEVRLGAARSLRQARNHLLVVKLKACLYPTSVYRCIGLIQWTREPHVGVAAGIRQRTTVREWCGIAATRPNPLCCLPLAREQCWADEDPFNLAPVSSNKVRGRIRCGWRTGGVEFPFFFFKLPS